jgi:hypothetical protein
MKKSLFTLVFAVVCAAAIFAQENPETAARGGGGGGYPTSGIRAAGGRTVNTGLARRGQAAHGGTQHPRFVDDRC